MNNRSIKQSTINQSIVFRVAATRNGPRNIDLCYFLGQVITSCWTWWTIVWLRPPSRYIFMITITIMIHSYDHDHDHHDHDTFVWSQSRPQSWYIWMIMITTTSMMHILSRTSSRAMCDATPTGRMAVMMELKGNNWWWWLWCWWCRWRWWRWRRWQWWSVFLLQIYQRDDVRDKQDGRPQQSETGLEGEISLISVSSLYQHHHQHQYQHHHFYHHQNNRNRQNGHQGPYVRTEGVRPEQEGDAIRYDVLSVTKEVKFWLTL